MGDMDVDRIESALIYIVVSPDGLIERVSIEDGSPIFYEDREELILLRGEFDLISRFLHGFCTEIYMYISEIKSIRRNNCFLISTSSVPFHDILDTQGELCEIDGFHEIIIRSE